MRGPHVFVGRHSSHRHANSEELADIAEEAPAWRGPALAMNRVWRCALFHFGQPDRKERSGGFRDPSRILKQAPARVD